MLDSTGYEARESLRVELEAKQALGLCTHTGCEEKAGALSEAENGPAALCRKHEVELLADLFIGESTH